jgi:hypothetical protein
LEKTELLFRTFEPGLQLLEAGHRRLLSQISACPRHHHPKNVIDARGVAGAVLLEPLEYVGIQTHGHQFLGRTPELAELLIRERRNIGIVDHSRVRSLLSLSNAL